MQDTPQKPPEPRFLEESGGGETERKETNMAFRITEKGSLSCRMTALMQSRILACITLSIRAESHRKLFKLNKSGRGKSIFSSSKININTIDLNWSRGFERESNPSC